MVNNGLLTALWPFGAGATSTIRTRIQWLVIACAVPVALLAVVLVFDSYRRARDTLMQANVLDTRALVQAVDHELDSTIQVLQTLATAVSIDDRNFQRFHARSRDVLKHVAADNIVLFDTELNGLSSAAHEWGTPLPKMQHDRFPQVLRDLKPAVSDTFMGQVSKKQQIAVAVPVIRGGQAVGRLEMVFTLGRFAEVLSRRTLPEAWTGAILDSKGVIVARSREAQSFVGKPGGTNLQDSIRRNVPEGSFEGRTVEGTPVVTSFSRNGKYGWVAAIGVPQSELHAQLERSLWITAACALVLLAIGLLLARAIGRRIAAPIQALVEPALRVGRGETVEVVESPLHEAHELGRALQQAQQLLRQREQARQDAEASMRDSQSRLKIALEEAQIGDWDIDLSTGVTRHSMQHDRCYGYTEPIVGWTTERFIAAMHPDDRARMQRSIDQAVQQRLPWQEEFRVVWPDGSVHHLSSRCVFLGDAPGFIVGVVMDITARKQAEELRLHSVRLQAENRQIQEANRLKSEFLANMSHELRTPLNAVIGFAEILRGNAALPETKRNEYLNHIAASGRHLLRLINDVLDLSKVESGKFDLAPEPLRLATLVQEVVAVLQPEAARKGVQVGTQVDAALGEVALDPARLKQMLYNLLSNAIKFTDSGGRVSVRALPEGLEQMRIEVEDTGIGIAADDLPKLFRQFQQVHTGMAKNYGGTGLGLVLTRHLAELHGGAVGVRSTPGVGSVFHLILPRRVSGAISREPQRPLQAPSAMSDAPTVLVIEDDSADQAQLTRILHTAGYRVEVAGTAERALQLANERRYDAITLDLLLPDRSGLEVLNALRSSGPNRSAPVVVITVVTETSALAGFAVNDVLTKPIRPHEVKTALQRLGGPDNTPSVLVVDDDPGTLELMVATLQTLGIAARTATSGTQALEMIEQQSPDALILDLVMPGLNGFDLLHALRRQMRFKHLPVFVWTSMQLQAHELAVLKASARAVVGKSGAGLDTLVEQLRAWQAHRAQGVTT
jgi:PAS domain S-box-containing protein